MSTTIEYLKGFNPYHLANMADCASPDSADSEGAVFLRHVQDSIVEAIEEGSFTNEDTSDVIHELVDPLVPIYSHEMWKAFVDLAAYQEDEVADFLDMSEGLDMGKAAAVALYMIGERLAWSLIRAWEEGQEAEAEEN